MFWTMDTREGKKHKIHINCPACGRSEVQATAWDYTQELRYIGLFTFFSSRITWVECSKCRKRLVSKYKWSKIRDASPEELEEFIYERISPTHHAMALGAVAASFAPFFGPFFGAVAALYNRKCPDWSRTVSYIGLGLNVLTQPAWLIFFSRPIE